ncbi:MAG: hypothetical protein ACYCWW_04255 [Deltaproteobacteria bacterium]
MDRFATALMVVAPAWLLGEIRAPVAQSPAGNQWWWAWVALAVIVLLFFWGLGGGWRRRPPNRV